MPKGAQYPKYTPSTGGGGNLPNRDRQPSKAGSGMGSLSRPSGAPKPTTPVSAPAGSPKGGNHNPY